MENISKLPNHAKFVLKDGQKSAEDRVILNNKKINMLHGIVDGPGARLDVALCDMNGVEQKRLSFGTANNRFGEMINLPVTDNYYIIKVENVSGTKNVDIFLE